MNNIQKAFKTKSKLRGMANGGIMEENVGGVRTFSDQRAAGSGARAYTPSSNAGSMSVVGMAPAQRAAMDASIASNRAGAAQAHEQRMGRAPDPTTALTNALNKVGTPPAGTTPAPGTAPATAPATASPLRAPARSLPPITVTPPPATAAAVPQLPTTTVFPPSAGMGGFEPTLSSSEDFYIQTPRFRDGGMHETHEYYPNDPMITGTRGGPVRGPGGPTDDKVGPVMLSDGEYVLPADTVEAVGKEKLDALRDATHTFVDPKKPKNGLRGLVNGGRFYGLPDGTVQRGPGSSGRLVPQPRMLPPPSGATPPPRGATPPSGVELPNYRDPNGKFRQTPTPTNPNYREAPRPAAKSSLRTAVNSGGGRTGSFLRGALPVATLGGAVDSFADVDSGYRDRFNESIGATGPVSSVAGDATRVMSNVGDAITFGLAGRLGRGLSNLGSGQSFIEGFMSESDRNKYNREQVQRVMGQQGGDAAADQPSRPVEPTAQPQSDQSRRLAEMGVPVDQQNLPPVTEGTRRSLLRKGGGTPGQYVNLGSYGGDANIYGTASKPGGRIDTFTGAGAPARPGGGPQEDPIMGEIRSALRGLTDGAGNRGGGGWAPSSNQRAINARYDKLASQLSGMYSRKGQGNLARRLLELEQSRSSALDADARNQSSLRGQDMQASTAANSAGMQARTQALQTLGTMANQRNQQIASVQAGQLRELQDAQKRFEEQMKDNAEVFESIADTFAAGDKEKQSQYRELLATLPPELHATAQDLAPEDKRAFYTNIVRQQLGRNEGLVLGRDAGATVQNAVIGGLVGRMARSKDGGWGKAVDNMLGKIPRVGRAISALRPAENLARFSTMIGAAGGAYATPEVENLTRWDPLARDPETGAALPARKDIREAATYGAFDTYLNPFDDPVQTVSGRRTRKPTPDEEEAARRFRSALRN